MESPCLRCCKRKDNKNDCVDNCFQLKEFQQYLEQGHHPAIIRIDTFDHSQSDLIYDDVDSNPLDLTDPLL